MEEVRVLRQKATSAETAMHQAQASNTTTASTIESLSKQVIDLSSQKKKLEVASEAFQELARESRFKLAQLTEKHSEMEPLLAYAVTERDAVQEQNKALLAEKEGRAKELETLRNISQRHVLCGPALTSATKNLFAKTEALAKQKADTESTIQHSLVAIEAHEDCDEIIAELRKAVSVLEQRLTGEREKVGALDNELSNLRLMAGNEEHTP
jgi:hypothetical protein